MVKIIPPIPFRANVNRTLYLLLVCDRLKVRLVPHEDANYDRTSVVPCDVLAQFLERGQGRKVWESVIGM